MTIVFEVSSILASFSGLPILYFVDGLGKGIGFEQQRDKLKVNVKQQSSAISVGLEASDVLNTVRAYHRVVLTIGHSEQYLYVNESLRGYS